MAPTSTPVEQDKPQQVAQRLKLVDPETASKPIADALALLPLINVFRAMANAETLYPYLGKYMLQLFRAWPASEADFSGSRPEKQAIKSLFPIC